MKQKISEAVISKLVEAVVKKNRPTIGERTEHARLSYRHVNDAIEKVGKLLRDEHLHPDVRQHLEFFSGHAKETLKGLNRMAVGQTPTSNKKEPSGRM